MSNPNKKQRQTAKRKAKKHEQRRKEAVSPLKRLAEAPGEVEIWITGRFEEYGQEQIFAFKRAAGLSGLGCFLVDRGVVGLKNAWTQLRVSRSAFQEMLDASADRDLRMKPATVEQARRLIAGAARWAHDNGMRLPKDWLQAASLLGGVGDWKEADLAGFIREFSGHPEDLRQRLVGEPFESYIQRPDVAFDLDEDATYLDHDTGQYVNPDESWDLDELESIAADIPDEELNALAEGFTPAATALAGETTRWLVERGETVSSELLEAWKSVLMSRVLAITSMPDAPQIDVAEFAADLLDDIGSRIEEARREEHHRAVDQVLDHLEADPTIMQRAMMKQGPQRD